MAEADIKEANSVVDSVLFCTPEILEITRWVADYYSSPLGEVIKAALPPGISPAIHEYLKVTAEGKARLGQTPGTDSNLSLKILASIEELGQSRRDMLGGLAPVTQLTNALPQL